MKSTYSSTFLALALGLTALRAEEGKITVPGIAGQTSPAAESPAAPAFTEAQLIEEFGWFMGARMNIAELQLSKSDIEALTKGFVAAAEGKESPYELEKAGPQMNEFMQKKQQAYVARLKTRNNEANTAFFTKLKENKNVVELPSGLRYEILKQGEGANPKATDTVKVHYTGTLIAGEVFDSSVERGTPAEFALNEVIPGWTEGIQKVSKGGKIKLYVPPHLAYGDDGRPGIPPSSTLIFDVELIDINPAAATPAPAAPATPAAK
jgi:FKBP-type peptidyl-prolyl cis-trans isomerase